MTPIGASLAAFIGAATLLTITPGLDTALVLRTLTTGAPRPALLAGFGIALAASFGRSSLHWDSAPCSTHPCWLTTSCAG